MENSRIIQLRAIIEISDTLEEGLDRVLEAMTSEERLIIEENGWRYLV